MRKMALLSHFINIVTLHIQKVEKLETQIQTAPESYLINTSYAASHWL